jgi:hypothetical protein
MELELELFSNDFSHPNDLNTQHAIIPAQWAHHQQIPDVRCIPFFPPNQTNPPPVRDLYREQNFSLSSFRLRKTSRLMVYSPSLVTAAPLHFRKLGGSDRSSSPRLYITQRKRKPQSKKKKSTPKVGRMNE